MTTYHFNSAGLARIADAMPSQRVRRGRAVTLLLVVLFAGIFWRAESLRGSRFVPEFFPTTARGTNMSANMSASMSSRSVRLMSAVATAFAMTGSVRAENAIEWRIADGGNGHWYGWGSVEISDATFLQSADAAVARGGHLPTASNAAENQFIRVNIGGGLGFYKPAGTESAWRNVTGEPVTYTNWAPGCPNNYSWQAAYAAYYGEPAYWDDFNEDGMGNPNDPWTAFRIEFEADCNNDGIVDFGQILAGELLDLDLNNVPDCCEQSENCNPCLGDISGDGEVNGVEIAILMDLWATSSEGKFDADLNDDGTVNGADLSIVLDRWGECP